MKFHITLEMECQKVYRKSWTKQKHSGNVRAYAII